ncbi:MAG TPA: flagellar M-ring protein FliF, partial [Parvularcula sp.]|nr:flagellar M-ring protein FliF [Parvularcula sp.]
MGTARSFGIVKLLAIAGVTIAVALMIYVMAARATAAPMALLYADLTLADGAEVADALEADGAKHEIREANGKVAVYVPANERARLKLLLAADGFVASSSVVGYEIFDGQDALGVTSFQQDINKLRAL